jgi:peptide/nickel transport system substrate-binding protein
MIGPGGLRTTAVRMLAALGVGVALVGCSAGAASTSTATSFPTSHTLNLSFLQDPGQPPDPDVFYGGEGLLLTRDTYQGLVQYATNTTSGKIIPQLATSWQISPDKLTYTFQLRQGVLFHDGTPFTSAAVSASFARRTAVNGGPAYMVSDVASVATPSPSSVVITLTQPNSAFLDLLASAWGPVMESPTALAKYAGTDNAQTYLTTNDIGTGPYTLTEAKVGVAYQLKAFPRYWGAKPYYTTVNLPVIDNISTQEIQFNSGQLAAILHDLTTSAVSQYRSNPKYAFYTMPIPESQTVFLNENIGFLKSSTARTALLEAINRQAIVAGTFPHRATVAAQAGPAHLLPPQYGQQHIPYDPSALTKVVATLSSADKTITIGYDTGLPDDQQMAEQIGATLQASGLTVKVVGYQTSQIYGWVGSTQSATTQAPNILVNYFTPDAANTYTWTHIEYDPTGGLNFLSCNVHGVDTLNAQGVATGSDATYDKAVAAAVSSGCWLNVANVDDAMVAQPWLKGIPQSHVFAAPETLNLATLYPG